MAVSDFDMLLEELGFDAAAYADRVGLVERKRDLAHDVLGLSGEEERRRLSNSYEGRGFLRSGEHQRSLAMQRANEANRGAQIDSAAAEDLANVDFMASQALANQQASDRYSDAMHSNQMDDMNWALDQLRRGSEADYDATFGPPNTTPYESWGPPPDPASTQTAPTKTRPSSSGSLNIDVGW